MSVAGQAAEGEFGTQAEREGAREIHGRLALSQSPGFSA